MNDSPTESIRGAWNGPDRARQLNRIVERLAAEGVARAVLDDALGALLDNARAAGADEADEEAIAGVGDRLHGWCHAGRRMPMADATLAPQTKPDAARKTAVR